MLSTPHAKVGAHGLGRLADIRGGAGGAEAEVAQADGPLVENEALHRPRPRHTAGKQQRPAGREELAFALRGWAACFEDEIAYVQGDLGHHEPLLVGTFGAVATHGELVLEEVRRRPGVLPTDAALSAWRDDPFRCLGLFGGQQYPTEENLLDIEIAPCVHVPETNSALACWNDPPQLSHSNARLAADVAVKIAEVLAPNCVPEHDRQN
mmetsp:Transcript_90996/g.254191  ORF Transcript_90996/g.254191 Transcript_90996/m.254191 type:complete len:209 (+) Transcript_90996:189-815(+)